MEYVPEPEYYEEGFTVEQMAEADINTDDRELLFDVELISDEIKYEIVEVEDSEK